MSDVTLLSWSSGFYPIGDVYPLDPLWSEWHTTQGVVLPGEDESIVSFNLIIPAGFAWFVDYQLVDVGADGTFETDDDVPVVGYVATTSSIKKPWGWSRSLAFVATPLLDDDDVWTGVVRLSLDIAAVATLGVGIPWTYQATVTLAGEPNYPVKVLAGYLVVRA